MFFSSSPLMLWTEIIAFLALFANAALIFGYKAITKLDNVTAADRKHFLGYGFYVIFFVSFVLFLEGVLLLTITPQH